MMRLKTRFKEGAASFYIVAFSTLILMIVAISFAAVIISEVERTSNDDLAQSAYDSALAGIEDGKLAYHNYQACLVNNTESCAAIIGYMEEANSTKDIDECDTVWKILGRRTGETEESEIVETTSGINNNMQQATTCVAMTNELPGYTGSLSPSDMFDVIKLSFVEGLDVDKITSMSLSWFSSEDAVKAMGNGATFDYRSYNNGFPNAVNLKSPPAVSLTLLQTGSVFDMDSFYKVGDGQTNRGTLYFVPKQSGGTNFVDKNTVVKSNSKVPQNDPIGVNCANRMGDNGSAYACSVEIGLPKPIGGTRNADTFEVIVSLPYGQPESEFFLQFYCGNTQCANETTQNGSNGNVATMKGVQVEIDSTGRANDLYRRVVATMNNKNNLALSVMGPLELLDISTTNNNAGLTKDWTVICEYNFFNESPTCP